MPKSKDLFDDSTMSFGDHLEALRGHLIKGTIGLVIAVIITLLFSDRIIAVIRRPIDIALHKYYSAQSSSIEEQAEQLENTSAWEEMKRWWNGEESPDAVSEEPQPDELPADTIIVEVSKSELLRLAKEVEPGLTLEPKTPAQPKTDGKSADAENAVKNSTPPESEKVAAKPKDSVKISVRSQAFADLRQVIDNLARPVALNVQEPFMVYLKVALVSGLMLSFPWLFYQMWLFISAGLYDHEKRYVYVFLPISMILFFGGAIFCYFAVFPYVLEFLLGFNAWLGITPQIRLSEWITFALLLPLMFGISFQLPLVMYFIERMGIVSHQAYTEKRRIAILIIATLSMFLTPADPMSMILMMVPLIILYELGIIFCKMNPVKNPYEIATR